MAAPPFELVPKHELLSESEAKKVAREMEVPFEKFPKIFESDPQAVKLGAKAGSLIAIHRQDPTGKYVAYRYVVKG